MEQLVFFFDIDGTILPENIHPRRIPDDTLAAIRAAQAQGHLCLINTGRARGCLDRNLLELGMDGIVSGCGAMAEIGGKVLWRQPPLSVERSREIIRAARELGVRCVFEGYDNRAFDALFEAPTAEQRASAIARTRAGGIPDIFLEEEPEFELLKILINKQRGGDWATLERLVPELEFVQFNEIWIECPPKGFDKGKALIRVMEHLGLPLSRSVAVGDSVNDLPMLRVCPNSVAMGNGSAKDYPVSYVTAEADKGGIARMMRHFGVM